MRSKLVLTCGLIIATFFVTVVEAVDFLSSSLQFIHPFTTIDFDDAPSGTLVTDRYLEQGIRFSRGNGQARLLNYEGIGRDTSSNPNVITTMAYYYNNYHYNYTNYLDVTFSQPTFELGAFFGNDESGFDFTRITLSIFNENNNLLGSVWVNANMNPSVDQFIGLRSDTPFSKARFQNNGGDKCIVLDDLSFSVPEPPAPEITYLEIIGPNEVAENFSASYKAIAHYDNNSTQDVTDSADWQVEPNMHASIEAGLLTTGEIYTPQEDITIYAQYTDDDVTVEAEKEVTIFAFCPTGSALDFDGNDDYVDCGNNDSLNVDGITISAWINSNVISGSGTLNKSIIAKKDRNLATSTVFEFYQPKGDYSKLGFAFNDGSWHSWGATNSVMVSGWMHVAVTYDGTSHPVFYVNGVVKANIAGGSLANLPSNTAPVYIGAADSGGITGYFDGTIDDVRIYDRALSAEEIRANMHTRLSGDEPGLVGCWDFDEGGEQVAYDLSPYGNHGRLGSMPNADDSDPAWVESDAPIGICTQEELVERNLSDVLDIKLDILEQLGIALAKEEAVINMLNTSFENRDFGSAKKKDVVKAKQKIHSAKQHEEQAEAAVDKSIEKLEDASAALGLEP